MFKFFYFKDRYPLDRFDFSGEKVLILPREHTEDTYRSNNVFNCQRGDVMKSAVFVFVVLVMVVFVSIADAVVSSTAHNLSVSRPAGALGSDEISEVCIFCHTPHNANILGGLDSAPLWNRKNTEVSSYTMYDQAELQGDVSVSPNSETMVCLSCHDGTLALNSMANLPEAGADPIPDILGDASRITADGKIAPTSFAFIGDDLSNDHPVSVDYDETVHHLRLIVDIDDSLALFGSDSTVECSSCHAVHGSLYPSFLRMSNDSSALCLACHDI